LFSNLADFDIKLNRKGVRSPVPCPASSAEAREAVSPSGKKWQSRGEGVVRVSKESREERVREENEREREKVREIEKGKDGDIEGGRDTDQLPAIISRRAPVPGKQQHIA
jgi:hypothetical protein